MAQCVPERVRPVIQAQVSGMPCANGRVVQSYSVKEEAWRQRVSLHHLWLDVAKRLAGRWRKSAINAIRTLTNRRNGLCVNIPETSPATRK
jgi:hypothetical protein